MSLNCERWEAMLDAFLEGRLDTAERELFLDHVGGCDGCRQLLELVSADLPELGDPDDAETPDLSGPILAATSGAACARAEALLGERPDGALTERGTLLLDEHLAHCADCRELARTLAWVMPAVEELADPELDLAFTYDVLRATAVSRSRKRSGRWSRLSDRTQSWWGGQLRRPQFVWEAAFAATVALVLIFGTPLSPARETPAKALEVVKAGPDWVLDRTGDLLQAAGGRLASLGDDLDERRGRTAPDRQDLKRHGKELGSALLRVDLDGASVELKAVREDMSKMWESWRDSRPDSLESME